MSNLSFLRNRGLQISIKAAVTFFLILLMLIPAQLINTLVRERQSFQSHVEDDISQAWALPQTFTPPYMLIPTTVKSVINKEVKQESSYIILMPEALYIKADMKTEYKQRSIYKMPVYTTDVHVQGTFNFKQVQGTEHTTLHWDKAILITGLTDIRGIASMQPQVSLQGQTYNFESVDPAYIIDGEGMSAAINLLALAHQDQVPFDMTLKIKGSKQWDMMALGKVNKIDITADWADPSFVGSFLPDAPNITANGFRASYTLPGINRNIPQVWEGTKYKTEQLTFGVKLYESSDNYTNVHRSIKYAILFIGLTFGLFFMFELIVGSSVHLVQYILVGIALVVFYTLLLSFSEYLGFSQAYVIASVAIIALITMYCKHLFHSWKKAIIVTLYLGLLYAFVYIIIMMKEWNLLAGSIGLFILIAAAMYFSRKINWYSQVPNTKE